jgi:WD40 repeat protein
MLTREKTAAGQIVRAGSGALAVRSAALVARGLRDLARDSNWLIKKVFNGHSPFLSVSSTGQVCAIVPEAQMGAERAVLYDMELSLPMMALSVPRETQPSLPDMPAAFGWFPTGRYLTGAWAAWQPAIHLFDLHGKMLLGAFGEFRQFPACLAWSGGGNYFASATSGGPGASIRLWNLQGDPRALLGPHAAEVQLPDWLEPQQAGDEFAAEGAFRGYGKTIFSPDERSLAGVVEIEGEWADDAIVIMNVPSLHKQNSFEVQGHLTDLAWTPDNRQIVFCAAGQAYLLDVSSSQVDPLPFGAELCACHPHLPLLICYSSWLKNSARGRLFLANLGRETVFDEHAAEGVVDLRWSLDGTKAYAMTEDGMGFIYEPPLV